MSFVDEFLGCVVDYSPFLGEMANISVAIRRVADAGSPEFKPSPRAERKLKESYGCAVFRTRAMLRKPSNFGRTLDLTRFKLDSNRKWGLRISILSRRTRGQPYLQSKGN